MHKANKQTTLLCVYSDEYFTILLLKSILYVFINSKNRYYLELPKTNI